jgi:hypothetical protein
MGIHSPNNTSSTSPKEWQINQALTILATFNFTGTGPLHCVSIFHNYHATPPIPPQTTTTADIPFAQWIKQFAAEWQHRAS